MTKTLLTSAILFAAAASAAWAQSPPASATVTVAGKSISVRYSAPSVRGRKIFGDGGLLSSAIVYNLFDTTVPTTMAAAVRRGHVSPPR